MNKKKSLLLFLLSFLTLFISVQAQDGNNVFAGAEAVNFGTVDLATPGTQTWSTFRGTTPGYFSAVGPASYTSASDAANIDGYVKYYNTAADQGFTFPVGTGSDLRTITTSGTIAVNSGFATAYIVGNPSVTTDPTDGNVHPVTSRAAGIDSVSTVGQWDWQDISATGAGVTVAVSIPNMSSFAHPTFLRLVGWNGTQWINLSATQGTTAANGNTENSLLTGTLTAGITAIGIGKAEAAYVVTKVFLQAPLSGVTMNTTLRNLNLIPLTQPYNAAPWNYTGTETVASIPAGVTDWVLIELRDATTPSTVRSRRAAFIKNDGSVVDLDGVSPVSFNDDVAPITPMVAGNYNIAIRHRNHLTVRTSVVQPLSRSSLLYDFTTAQSRAYQNPAITTNAAMRDMGGGVFAMWGGNASNNNTISYAGLNNDLVAILAAIGGVQSNILTNVYNRADINMNGVVRYSGINNDNSFLLSILGGVQETIYSQHQ